MASQVKFTSFNIADAIMDICPGYFDGMGFPSDQQIEALVAKMRAERAEREAMMQKNMETLKIKNTTQSKKSSNCTCM